MSKKDYELIAGVFRDQWEWNNRSLNTPYESDTYYARYEARLEALDDAIRDMAVKLSADNSRFDREKFIKACMGVK
jgi:FAD/FMN-containing dehydrogenase